jgi:hypothetical protein
MSILLMEDSTHQDNRKEKAESADTCGYEERIHHRAHRDHRAAAFSL